MPIQISPPIQNEDENQAIDRMFAFVKHEHMETPKSSIITRHRSVSTPRRPLATSTPIVPNIVKPSVNPLSKSFNTSSVMYPPRQVGPCGDGGTANSRNTSTTTSSAPVNTNAPKMDESITRAVNQQQAFQSKCRAILSEIAYQQDQIVQANEILSICQKKLLYSGTFQEMNAQRTLLVANERRFALYRQLERLKKIQHSGGMPVLPSNDSSIDTSQLADLSTLSIAEKYDRTVAAQFALNITSIKVLLNRSFYIKTVDKDISFAFVVLCKTDDHMFATQLMNVMDMGTLRVSTVQFRESIRFQNLTPDFKIVMEIYALKIGKRSPVSRSSRASKIASRAKALVAGAHGKKPTLPVAPGGLYATSDFRRCGLLHVDASSKGKQRFLLEEVEYPLEGTVEMRCEYF